MTSMMSMTSKTKSRMKPKPDSSDRKAEPARDCPLCPRLVAYREQNRQAQPQWFNGPAPSFGDPAPWLMIVGLAPGRTGANRTGRPFTGDYAGKLLYATLAKFGLSHGAYASDPGDGLTLDGVMITNAVRCAPPANKPETIEILTCNSFLAARLETLDSLTTLICLGKISHDATLRALGHRPSQYAFAHGAEHQVGRLRLIDSYHCSRYNTQTRRLTVPMFEAVFAKACRDQTILT
jgi:uracil-DNA glycosylase